MAGRTPGASGALIMLKVDTEIRLTILSFAVVTIVLIVFMN